MQRQIIQRPDFGPGGCNILGLQFSEQCVKGIDAGLIMCFCYMVIVEICNYSKYEVEGGCIKPFGLFWIGQYTSIVLFRVFYHLERYAQYRLSLMFLERDNTRLRRAHFRAYYMKGCKLSAFSGFVVFTIIGSVWLVQDGRCLNNLDHSSRNNSEIKMAFWLFASFTVCLIYSMRVLIKLIFERAPSRELIQGDANGQFNLFLWADQGRGRGDRSLTQRELNTIKKTKLRSYDELSRFASNPTSLSQPMPSKISALPTNELMQVNEDVDEVIEEFDIKQDESNTSQVTCAVCLENIEIGEWYKKLPNCEHCFHATCIDQWLSTRATCPICREKIYLDESANHSVSNGNNPPAQTIPRNDNESRFVLRITG